MNLYRSLKWCLGLLSFLWIAMPLGASDFSDRMDNYALRYSRTKQPVPVTVVIRENDLLSFISELGKSVHVLKVITGVVMDIFIKLLADQAADEMTAHIIR